ncbi:SecDF P1 head subdomain-containing protein [Gordonia sp. (in: high G+C Gram-positive bacteria)]|uniref:SecDF P1 head subdomain-containing protein n=1 Tax=Gordonia sp. (in: high G+C Gram-positive bacteria) TaxID=84139 RepID=UPI0039E461A9
MKRAPIAVLALLLPLGLLVGCSRDSSTSDKGGRVEFGVESMQSTDGEFPPGADKAKLVDETVTTLTARLTKAGLKDPKVEAGTNGDTVTVSTASGSGDDITALAGSGGLRIRPVLFDAPASAENEGLDVELRQANPETPQAEMARRAQMLKCGGDDPLLGRDEASALLATCSADDKTVYSLGPALAADRDVTTAVPGQVDGKWTVKVGLAPQAQERVSQYTSANNGKSLAYVLDTRVETAAKVDGPSNGEAAISGNSGFTEAEAKNLATVLVSGPLLVRLVPKS